MDIGSIGTMGAAPIRLRPERCLNLRHHKAACAYCVESCPAEALRIEDRTVVRDESVCIGCGLCLSACPMEVFTSRVWSERHVLESIAESPEPRVELLCALHPEGGATPARPGVMHLSVCLAALSPGLLFEAGLEKHVDLRADACADCPARSLAHVENSAALAGTWLAATGREGRVSLSSQPAAPVAEETKRKRRRSDGRRAADEAKWSRRDFLTGFARDGSSLFAAFLGVDPLAAGLEDIGEAAHSPKRPHTHRWREALSKAYPRLLEEGASPAIWPHVELSDACTNCGVCEQYCPNEAVNSRIKGGRLKRTFTPGLCADCALCALSCPMGAVKRGYAPCEHPFEPNVITDIPVVSCSRCHAPVAGPEGALCHWCASEPPLESVLGQARRVLLSSDKTRDDQ